MAFNGTEGEMIPLEDAAQMTANYRARCPNDMQAHFYGKDKILELLGQTGAMGIRAYYGVDNMGVKQLVLVAADANENDILGLTLDLSKNCPPRCSNANALNGGTSSSK